METPVTGGSTPLSLGELRQAILAVVVGNPLFTPEEQLLINHEAHEREGYQELSQWLRALRLDEAERGMWQRISQARLVPTPGVCLDPQAQLAEMRALLACQVLNLFQKGSMLTLVGDPNYRPYTRLRFLGDSYALALRNSGYPEPKQVLLGIFSN